MSTPTTRKSLNGAWRFLTDPKENGETRRWFEAEPDGTRPVTVPHIWQREPDLVGYCGVAWYYLRFSAEAAAQAAWRTCIRFEAVDYEARIWLNGKEIGRHEGGFLPFRIDLTSALRPGGENLLAVRVFDPKDNGEIPIGKQGSWYTRVSGIWQDVWLEELPPVRIDGVDILPEPDKGGFLARVRPGLGLPAGAEITYSVCEHEGGRKKAEGVFAFSPDGPPPFIAVPDARLWEPDDPFLYELILRHGEDEHREIFGLRSISVNGNALVLNGRTELCVRGALDQAFYPDTVYVAPSDEAIIEEIRLAKQMGFNLLRKHIKAEIPRYLYWADRLGLLIWAEYPNYVKWTPTATQRFAAQLEEMIARDFNHPSIIIWSLYNEEWGLEWDMAGDPEKQRHVAALYDRLKLLDPTRLLCDNSGWTHVKTDINDHHPYFALPDALDGWRTFLHDFVIGNPDGNFVPPHRYSGQPIMVSEFGTWSIPDLDALTRRYGGSEPWWFVNQGEAEHQEDYKMPVIARDRFEPLGLKRIFGSWAELSRHSSERMFTSVKAVISEMRLTLRRLGYVVTEFTDLEWETNGWLDFFRQLKPGFENAADFNGPLALFAALPKRAWWSGEECRFDLVVANDGARPFTGTLRWRVEGTDLAGETERRTFTGAGERLGGFSFVTPDLPEALSTRLIVELVSADGGTVRNYEDLVLVPRGRVSGSVAGYGLSPGFAAALAERGWKVEAYRPGELVLPILCESYDAEMDAAARAGGRVLFLAEQGDRLAEKGRWSFRELPQGESWARASSFQYFDSAAFPGVPMRKSVGWDGYGIMPRYVVPVSDYQKQGGKRAVNIFGDANLPERVRILAGYFQGWLGQVGVSLLESEEGGGRLTLTTWRLAENYGVHPVGTLLLEALIAKARIG